MKSLHVSEDQNGSKVKGSTRFFTIGLVAAWYSSNIGVLLLNKYLLSTYGFKYPIFLTMCHMIACSLFSYVAIVWMKVVPMQTIQSKVQFFKISALSLIFCISLVFGNISLRYITVSFNQAIGATTPFFTAIFAYIMTFKREGLLTYPHSCCYWRGYCYLGRTEFPFIWIHYMCCGYSCKSPKISTTRNFAFF
jgi:hypothetical protein